VLWNKYSSTTFSGIPLLPSIPTHIANRQCRHEHDKLWLVTERLDMNLNEWLVHKQRQPYLDLDVLSVKNLIQTKITTMIYELKFNHRDIIATNIMLNFKGNGDHWVEDAFLIDFDPHWMENVNSQEEADEMFHSAMLRIDNIFNVSSTKFRSN